MWYPVWDGAYKRTLAAYQKGTHEMVAAAFLSHSVSTCGVLGHQINPSWWTHGAISHSSQISMTGVTNTVGFAILSVGWCR